MKVSYGKVRDVEALFNQECGMQHWFLSNTYYHIGNILDKYWIIFYPRNTSEMQEMLRLIINEFKALLMGQACSPGIRKEIGVLCKKGVMQQLIAKEAITVPVFKDVLFSKARQDKMPGKQFKLFNQFVKKQGILMETVM